MRFGLLLTLGWALCDGKKYYRAEPVPPEYQHGSPVQDEAGFVVLVHIRNEPRCQAALIARLWAVTTCLCVQNSKTSEISLKIGDPEETGQKYKYHPMKTVIVHRNCIVNSVYNCENDIALLQLAQPFNESINVFPVKVPRQLIYWTPDSTLPLEISSWIDLKYSVSTIQEAVWRVMVYITNPILCLKAYPLKNYKLGETMCGTYWHKHNQHNCSLDYGAPLTFEYNLIGLLIYKNDGCGSKDSVASYVNVPMHSEWIRNITRTFIPWITL